MAIRIGTLLPGATPVGMGTTHPRRGFVWVGQGTQVAVIVKQVPMKSLAAEVFCSALGRAAELPIPEPMVVLDPEKGSLLFGSVYQDYPNLLQKFQFDPNKATEADLRLIFLRLLQWTRVSDVIGFDEWINNVDRNLQNILWDGFDEFVLIDHGLTLGLAPKELPDMNKLLHYGILALMPSLPAVDDLKEKVLRSAIDFERSCADDAADALASVPWTGTPQVCDAYLQFVTQRLPKLVSILMSRFPSQQMSLELQRGK